MEGLLRYCFSLRSACKRKYFRLRRGLLLVVVVLLVDQVCDLFVQVMRNSNPRVRIVFVNRFNYDFHSMLILKVTGCNFQHGSNFGVPLNPTFRSVDFSSRGKIYSRHVTGSANCKNSSVCFCHEVLSSLNCFQESFISTNFYQLIWLWKVFHSSFVLLQ